MQMYITKNGSKPSASSFKREYCGAIINQKVPKVFEVYRQKRAPARSEGSRRREISVKIQEKQGFLPHKRDNCRICLVDKFGNYHGRGRRLRPKLRFRPGLGSDMPPACHSLPRPFEAFCSFTQNKHRPNGRCLFWKMYCVLIEKRLGGCTACSGGCISF